MLRSLDTGWVMFRIDMQIVLVGAIVLATCLAVGWLGRRWASEPDATERAAIGRTLGALIALLLAIAAAGGAYAACHAGQAFSARPTR